MFMSCMDCKGFPGSKTVTAEITLPLALIGSLDDIRQPCILGHLQLQLACPEFSIRMCNIVSKA